MGKRRGFSMIEALVAIALTGIGVAGAVGALGAMNRAETNALGTERIQRIAIDKYDELVATGDYNFTTSGDFTDKGLDGYEWEAQVDTTGVEGLDQLTVVVNKTTGASRTYEISGLIYATQTSTGGGGQ